MSRAFIPRPKYPHCPKCHDKRPSGFPGDTITLCHSDHPETFAQARARLMAELSHDGWMVQTKSKIHPWGPLKVPYATSEDGSTRLWFKPQALYVSHGTPHNLSEASSLTPDYRGLAASRAAMWALELAKVR